VTGPEDEQRLRAEADPPGDPIFVALDAYKARFGDTVTVMGIPSDCLPVVIAELEAALRDGRKRTDADIRRALGWGELPPGAVI
jgi:hypothetical protein